MLYQLLFRRVTIWVPTLAGLCAGLAIIATVIVGMLYHIHSFLAVDEPSDALLLVIEGWITPNELDQAVTRFRGGGYTGVITTGGAVPDDLSRSTRTSYAALARDYLLQRGLPESAVTAVPAPESAQDRTYLSAVMVRDHLSRSGQAIDAIDVYSSGVHSRRTHALYRMAFGPQVRVGILSAQPVTYDPDHWWRTSVGAKTVLSEWISWIWTVLFFHPAPPGSHEEKWGPASQSR
ncbi:MAG: hypothetical protein AB7E73_09410 [Burkholderiales bacterium]